MADHQRAIEVLRQLGLGHHWNNTTIVAEALERNIDVTRRDESRSLLFTHSGRTHSWHRGRTSYNSLVARRIADDKVLTSRYLAARGFSVPQNALFPPGAADRAWAWGGPIGPLVVKPFNGIKGRGVHVNLSTHAHFSEAFDSVANQYGDVLVEQYCTGNERRFLVVNNRLVGALNRRPPSIVGDGVSTIETLVNIKNERREEPHHNLHLDDESVRVLQDQGFSFSSVPDMGLRVNIRNVINIHAGGDAVDITESVTDGQRDLAEAAARSLPGLRLVGFDVFLPSGNDEQNLTFIEMNTNPDIAMHHYPYEGKPRNVAGAILDGMFPSSAEIIS